MPVFLIGYMGSGKSIIGRRLSTMLDICFLDLDNLIEEKTGMEINEIFKKKGENFFRKTEHRILLNYKFDSNSIIATGGGTPCFYDNHKYMQSIGNTIYLKVSFNEILNRLQSDNKRPLLFNNDLNLKNCVKEQIISREKFYLNSNYVIESDNISADQILKLLKTIF